MGKSNRTFDWRPRHDTRSIKYAVRDLVAPLPTKELWWAGGNVLDQGSEGACAGFAAAGEAAASPVRVPNITNKYAFEWYARAKKLDEWPGEKYDGTSVNATMKVGLERKLWDSYHWAFGADDVKRALMIGPVVIGIKWYDGMYETKGGGLVKIDGECVGGHAILVTGWSPSYNGWGEVFRWRNSWGEDYGRKGDGYVKAADFFDLLKDGGEAAVPTGRALGMPVKAKSKLFNWCDSRKERKHKMTAKKEE